MYSLLTEWACQVVFGFQERSNELISKPDLVAILRNDGALGVGNLDDYKSPEKSTKAGLRRDNVAMVRSLVRFPFETKPCWKFRFLCHAHAMNDLTTEWDVPEEFDQEKCKAKMSYRCIGQQKRRRFSMLSANCMAKWLRITADMEYCIFTNIFLLQADTRKHFHGVSSVLPTGNDAFCVAWYQNDGGV